MGNVKLDVPPDSRQSVVLGRITICGGCRLQSGEDCLWIDPPSGNTPLGKGEKVFLTHLPEQWGEHLNGAKVFLGEKDRRLLRRQGDCLSRLFHLFQLEGFPSAERVSLGYAKAVCRDNRAIVPVGSKETFRFGQCTAQCIHTPGPTPGYTCLYFPEEQILFAGELLFQPAGIGGWKNTPYNLEDWINSLEKLKELAVKLVFPTWTGAERLSERADRVIRNCYFRILELFHLVQDHPGSTAYALACKFSRKEAKWDALSPNEKWAAMNETLSYLNYLRKREFVRVREGEDGLVNLPGSRNLTDI